MSSELNKDLSFLTRGIHEPIETKGINMSILGRNSVRKRMIRKLRTSFEKAEMEIASYRNIVLDPYKN